MPEIIWMKNNRLTIIKEEESHKSLYKDSTRKRTIRMVRCKCDCWNEIVTRLDYIKSWNSKSCGCLQKEKAYKSIKELHKVQWKELNPNWRWWFTSEYKMIRHSEKYNQWRISVFNRDNYTCRITWKNKWYLAVHHIKNFNSILRDNNIITLSQSYLCDELWDINNWITMLNSVHNKFHWIYWRKLNTIEQLNEFKLRVGSTGA